eukprot:snap_masked-scaffold_32-processed-gene-2.19-mRNA-1 protein AED:1.00 eAED:1.00 QI:0/-1/0/0/-1/1/1/0/446
MKRNKSADELSNTKAAKSEETIAKTSSKRARSYSNSSNSTNQEEVHEKTEDYYGLYVLFEKTPDSYTEILQEIEKLQGVYTSKFWFFQELVEEIKEGLIYLEFKSGTNLIDSKRILERSKKLSTVKAFLEDDFKKYFAAKDSNSILYHHVFPLSTLPDEESNSKEQKQKKRKSQKPQIEPQTEEAELAKNFTKAIKISHSNPSQLTSESEVQEQTSTSPHSVSTTSRTFQTPPNFLQNLPLQFPQQANYYAQHSHLSNQIYTTPFTQFLTGTPTHIPVSSPNLPSPYQAQVQSLLSLRHPTSAYINGFNSEYNPRMSLLPTGANLFESGRNVIQHNLNEEECSEERDESRLFFTFNKKLSDEAEAKLRSTFENLGYGDFLYMSKLNSKKYGYVKFATSESAKRAMNSVNMMSFDGGILKIKIADPPPKNRKRQRDSSEEISTQTEN